MYSTGNVDRRKVTSCSVPRLLPVSKELVGHERLRTSKVINRQSPFM